MRRRRRPRARRQVITPLGILDAAFVVAVIFVTVWALHPNLLVSSSLITGGDTGSHLAMPAFLRQSGNVLHPLAWYPGWFDGIPGYSYYFVLPDLLAALASYVINFAVAFKLATVLGSVLLPIAAYAFGRLCRAPRPIPVALAVATLPFLFDASFTIVGGNLYSTMAGEYAFSLSLALALLAIGLFARGLRTGRGYWLSAIALSATLAAHILPWFFALGAIAVFGVVEIFTRAGEVDPAHPSAGIDRARPIRFALGAGLLSFGLSAWWLLPFGTTQSLTDSLGYVNVNRHSLHDMLSVLGWFNATGGAGGDRWVIILAALGAIVAIVARERFGLILSSLTALSLVAFVADPQSAIWNQRLLPFWFLTTHLLVGWLAGFLAFRWAHRLPIRYRWRPLVVEGSTAGVPDDPSDPDAADVYQHTVVRAPNPSDEPTWGLARLVRATAIVGFAGLLSTVPGLVTPLANDLHLATTGNQVSSWAQWNYSGYQAKAAWPEYHGLIKTVSHVAQRYGCGRAMWEYSSDQNRFGTPEALMLLPYWTDNCVDSMEGLFMESSPTTPYHYLDQAELSAAPSDPQVGLHYGPLDVTKGVRHLQILGVKYFIAFSPSVVAAANADPALRLVASTRDWPAPGAQWRIYLVRHAPEVVALRHTPNVLEHASTLTRWLNANETWWLRPKLQSVFAAESGPASWPRAASVRTMERSALLPRVKVRDLHVGLSSISFTVSRVGVPVLVKTSYYPRWRATGATGPYRVSPNLMVVVPTSTHVSLVYASTTATSLGDDLSAATVLLGIVVALFYARRRRRVRR